MTGLLSYDLHGPAGTPVVVLGSSLGTTRDMWAEQLPAFAGQLRVLRYDHLGHGGSPVPPGPYTVAGLAADVIALLDHLGIERAHFGGLSLGGMVAMQVAATQPERVDRLALLCTSAHLPPASGWTARAAAVRSGGMAAVAGPVAARWFTPAFAGSARAAQLRDGLLTIPAEGYAGCCEAIAAMDLRPQLTSIRAPVLVIAGDADPATPPPHADRIAAGIRAGGGSARVKLVSPAAHLANVEQSAAVTGLMLSHWTGQQD